MYLLWGVTPLLYTYVTRRHALCNSSLGDANRVASGTTKTNSQSALHASIEKKQNK